MPKNGTPGSLRSPSPLGAALRKVREERAWSQADLARELGCAISAVSLWESGERRPSGIYALRIAALLPGLNIEALISAS